MGIQMFSSKTTEWRCIADLPVQSGAKKECLVSLLKGNVTLLLVGTRPEHLDICETMEHEWSRESREDSSHKVTKLGLMLGDDVECEHPITRSTCKGWDLVTCNPLSKAQLSKWLADSGIPQTFREETGAAEKSTIGCPMIFLIDGDGIIRRSLLGVCGRNMHQQKTNLNKMSKKAQQLKTKIYPDVPSPAISNTGIGADEILSRLVE